MREDGDLAEPVSGAEVSQLPAAPPDGSVSLDENEELPATLALLRQLVACRGLALVRAECNVDEIGLRALREERSPASAARPFRSS